MTVRQGELSKAWLRLYRARPCARLRLVCFPHAGGTASFYRPWLDRLPPTIELVGVQYPGRENRIREPCLDEMHRLADAVTDALTRALDLPVALFGHSMGAAVAYEVALRLEQRRDDHLVRLFVSGQGSPRHQRGGTKHLWDDHALWAEVARLGGTSQLLDPEIRTLVLPAMRSDYRLIETYRPTPGRTLECAIGAFLGDADSDIGVDEVRGWGEFTRGRFDLRVFAGSHFYLVGCRPEVIEELLRCLGSLIPARE